MEVSEQFRTIRLMYLAGLIAADGHIEEDGHITIAQKNRDFIDIIKIIAEKAGVNISSIFYDKGAGVWKIKIKDKEFLGFLLSNGLVVGEKSTKIRPPNVDVNSREALAYMIGFIDGDGWVEQVKKKTKKRIRYYLRVGIKTKSREIRDWFIKVLEANGIRANKADKKDGYEVHIDTLLAWKIASYLLNPKHKERLMYIRDDRVLKS